MSKIAFDITPFTTTDYQDHISAIVWFSGCNMRCKYCYNTNIVLKNPRLSSKDILDFLDKRQGKLDAVVFSGGECTINREFLFLAKEIKNRNFKLKVDTNGSNLKAIKDAINIIDFISLDFKALKSKFRQITNSNLYDEFINTLDFLISINFNFEIRTTVHEQLFNEKELSQMANLLFEKGYKGIYYLQNFLYTDDNLGNLKEQKDLLNIQKISSPIEISLRNFKI